VNSPIDRLPCASTRVSASLIPSRPRPHSRTKTVAIRRLTLLLLSLLCYHFLTFAFIACFCLACARKVTYFA
jgi:hypothetical protein